MGIDMGPLFLSLFILAIFFEIQPILLLCLNHTQHHHHHHTITHSNTAVSDQSYTWKRPSPMIKASTSKTTAVQVALRIRPLTDSDRKQPRFANLSDDDVLKSYDKTVKVVPQNKLFTFDYVFGTASTQEEIFTSLGENLIHKFVEGYNITILAYGQTSSGKTYTMGTASSGAGIDSKDEGIVPRSMALLFNLLYKNNEQSKRPISPAPSVSSSTTTSNKSNRSKSKLRKGRSSHIPSPSPMYQKSSSYDEQNNSRFTVKVSFVEIYNEELHDLLNSAPLHELPTITIREDTKGRIYWTGVKEVTIHSVDDALYYLEQGTQNRATGATDMNEKSSRSHAIFSVSLRQEKWVPSDAKQKLRSTSALSLRSMTPSPINNRHASNSNLNQPQQQQEDGEWLITTSKFHFVDLAGSERLKRTAAEGDRRKEGISINAGLLALGNVISALGDPSKKSVHVPYRDSKLTRLLQDSLGGNATTLMIACVSPVEYNLSETLNTLQYANRARNIKNRSEKNQIEEWMLTENTEILRAMISKLKNELQYFKLHQAGSKIRTITHHHQHMNDDSSTEEESLSLDELYQDQQRLISDLQRQVEELDGEASVTRERNRLVEKELQRLQLIEAMLQQQQQQQQQHHAGEDGSKSGMDFQHLVEPVIEEYEKSVSKLESQLAMMKAALNHSNMTYEEQQNEINRFDAVVAQQEETINELRSRLSKVLEREQTNETYIQELESKLTASAKEASRDQEMLTDLRNRILKFKESDENTEQYISDLEQRLTTADNERLRLRDRVDKLETALIIKERKNVELSKQITKMDTDNADTVKSIMKELNSMKQKYEDLENERTTWKETQAAFQKEKEALEQMEGFRRNDSIVASSSIDSCSNGSLNTFSDGSATKVRKAEHRKSLAEETETASSILALHLAQSEARLDEEITEKNQLKRDLDNLRQDHTDTLNELEALLLQYHEAMEELDSLKNSSSTPESTAIDNKSLPASQAEYSNASTLMNGQCADCKTVKEQESKEMHTLLEQFNECKRAFKDKDAGLEQLNKDYQKHGDEMAETIEKLRQKVKAVQDELLEETQTAEELKMLVQQKANESDQLQDQLDTMTQQATNLQKRLSETLASLTVLKLSNEELQQRLYASEERHISLKGAENENTKALEQLKLKQSEELSVLTAHFENDQSKIRNEMQEKIVELKKLLENSEIDNEAANKEITVLKEQIEQLTEAVAATERELVSKTQQLVDENKQIFDKERNTLQQRISELKNALQTAKSQQTESSYRHEGELTDVLEKAEEARLFLEKQVAKLNQQLEKSKSSLDKLRLEHEKEIQVLSLSFESGMVQLEDRISTLESELAVSKNINEELVAGHKQRLEEAIVAARMEENEKLNQRFSTELNEQQQKITALQSEMEQLVASKEMLLNEYQTYRREATEQANRDRQISHTETKNLQTSLILPATAHTRNEGDFGTIINAHSKQNQDSHNGREQRLCLDFEALTSENLKLKRTLSKMKKAYEQHLTAIYHHPEPLKQPQSQGNGAVAAKIALLGLQSIFTGENSDPKASEEPKPVKSKAAARPMSSSDDAVSELCKQLSQVVEENKSLKLLQSDREQLVQQLQTQIADQALQLKELHNGRGDHNLGLHNPPGAAVHGAEEAPKTVKESAEPYQKQIADLEQQMKQLMDENTEYGSLTEELGKEIHEVLFKNETLTEKVKAKEQELALCLTKLHAITSLFNERSSSVDDIINDIERLLLLEKSSNSSSLKTPTATLPQPPTTPSSQDFIAESKQRQEADEARIRELQHLNEMQQKHLQEEREKRERAELAIKKLEKKIDELLRKKSSLLCF